MTGLTYRGRAITSEDILFIEKLIAAHPGESRRTLSTKLCEAWQWRQANGALRDMVCRGMLLMLHRAGHIELRRSREMTRECSRKVTHRPGRAGDDNALPTYALRAKRRL